MHLVGETAFMGDLDDRLGRFPQHEGGPFDATPHDELVKGYSHRLLEQTPEVIRAYARPGGEIGNRKAFRQPFLDQIPGPIDKMPGQPAARRSLCPFTG